jgi:putative DNA primase/helicase
LLSGKKQFQPDQQIKNLDALIVEKELALVVDWCLEGLQRLLKRGKFEMPGAVMAATKREQEISNTVEQFKDAYFLELDEEYKMLKEDCYQTYLDYCDVQNYTPMGNVEFWKRVRMIFPTVDEKKVTVQSEGGIGHTTRKKFMNLKFAGDMYVAGKLFEGKEVDEE